MSYISRACSSLVRQPYYAPNCIILKISGLETILATEKGRLDGRTFYIDEYTLIFLFSQCKRCAQKRYCWEATRCSEKIQKYLGITLLPQAGVALGMAAEAAELSDGHMVRNVVLFSVLVYELVGPTLAKLSLTAAGEIIPEGRTSARTTNKPEEPVSVE